MGEQRESPWNWVARSMWLGAAYDFVFAVSILFATAPAARFLSLPLPDDLVYLRLNGIFLLILAGCYVLPATRPERYRGVVSVAVIGRFLGFVYLGSIAWSAGSATFLALALADLFFSMLHLGLLLRARVA